jgi:peptide deformylase
VAVIPIVRLGQPNDAVLRNPSKRVRDVRDPAIQRLIEAMFETMRKAPGVGLAAPQVGVPLRLIVVEKTDDEHPAFALANPEIVRANGRRRVTEGCLSVPGYQGDIARAESVVVKGIGTNGKEMRIKAPKNSLLSQALEHEIDHINGNLYIDHLDTQRDLYRIDESRTGTPREVLANTDAS